MKPLPTSLVPPILDAWEWQIGRVITPRLRLIRGGALEVVLAQQTEEEKRKSRDGVVYVSVDDELCAKLAVLALHRHKRAPHQLDVAAVRWIFERRPASAWRGGRARLAESALRALGFLEAITQPDDLQDAWESLLNLSRDRSRRTW